MIRKLFFTVLTLILGVITTSVSAQSVMGFSEDNAKTQLQLEADYDQLLNATNLDTWMKYMTARPHHVGSPYDKKVVDFVATKFKEWGYEVRIEKFDVLFPTPKLRLVEMLAPTKI